MITFSYPQRFLALLMALASSLPFAARADAPAPDSVQVVFQVTDANPAYLNMALANAMNLVKRYPDPRQRKLEIVAYGPGVEGLRFDSPMADRVAAAIKAGVEIKACENTLTALHVSHEDMLPDLGYVPLGVVEIIARQKAGYTYIRP